MYPKCRFGMCYKRKEFTPIIGKKYKHYYWQIISRFCTLVTSSECRLWCTHSVYRWVHFNQWGHLWYVQHTYMGIYQSAFHQSSFIPAAILYKCLDKDFPWSFGWSISLTRHPSTLEGKSHCTFLQGMFLELLCLISIPIRLRIWFQHDGAPVYFSLNVQNFLGATFLGWLNC